MKKIFCDCCGKEIINQYYQADFVFKEGIIIKDLCIQCFRKYLEYENISAHKIYNKMFLKK